MKLQTQNGVILTSQDEIFTGTPLADEEFTFVLKRLGRTERLNTLMASLTGELNDKGQPFIDQGLKSKNDFMSSVDSFTGFTDEDGKEIECTDETKLLMYEYLLPKEIYNAINKKLTELNGLEETIKKPVSDISEEESSTDDTVQSV